jgi:hypothetical protein
MQEKSQNTGEGDNTDYVKLSQSDPNNEGNKNKKLTSKEKGKIAEKLFEIHLNKLAIPFFRIDQEQYTQSEMLRKKGICRPDYIIQTKNDYYYVDVKYRKYLYYNEIKGSRFTMDLHIFFSLKNFFSNFYKDIWLAFTKSLKTPDFFYVPLSLIINYYEKLKNALVSYKYDDIKEYNYPKHIYKKLYLYIPNNLFFNSLSFDKGFYKDLNIDVFNKDASFHNEKWKEKLIYISPDIVKNLFS